MSDASVRSRHLRTRRDPLTARLPSLWAALRGWFTHLLPKRSGDQGDPAADAQYRHGMTPLRRRLIAAVALLHLALSPLYAWLDVRLWRLGPEHHLQAYGLMTIHVWTLAGAAMYLALFARRLGSADTNAAEQRLLRIAAWHFVAIPSALAITNQLASGAVTIYAVGLIALIVLAYERPETVTRWVSVSAVLVLTATLALQRDPGALVTAFFNVSVAAVGTIAVYHLYDRHRSDAYQRESELDRLNSLKDTIFQALDHDLKTPIMRVRRVARALDETPTPLPANDAQRLVQELDAAARQVSLVVDNLVAIAAPGPAPRHDAHTFALAPLVEQAVAGIDAQAAAKRITLEVALEDDVLVVGHEMMALAVLRNLLDNAVKFSPVGSCVELVADIGDELVRIAVLDRGIGLAPEIAERLARGEPVRGSHGTQGETGTGIGLVVARRFVAASGSTLRVTARGGGGTEASFDLQRYRRPGLSVSPDTPTTELPARMGAWVATR